MNEPIKLHARDDVTGKYNEIFLDAKCDQMTL